ncbi:hypothetical protein HK099_006074 [Clydaea vesicula]|uniref:MOSC domain-containing protein n=1 Tax=Clydaea vesicula TaxID=447962 RepID=A0AAD5U658_9FUNG|nr:hypothetical protein HK099_006074 [Clydaea vesicula]KAJ3397114.1 hypothetical protein HDU92_000814 [Lobulomyces angularis]
MLSLIILYELLFNKATPEAAEVSDLLIYPIKSCGSVSNYNWPVNRYGFELDRFWVLAKNGSKISQRECPQMAKITIKLQVYVNNTASSLTTFTAEKSSSLKYLKVDENIYFRGGNLVCSAPGMKTDLIIRFGNFKSNQNPKSTKIDVFGSIIDGIDEGDEASQWFSEYLQLSDVRLFVKADTVRSLPKKHTPKYGFNYQPQTAFADGFPVLLVSETSLADLNLKLKSSEKITSKNKEISVLNFRPNIVLKEIDKFSLSPFIEETWGVISIGKSNVAHKFFVASRCTRCEIPCNDLETGVIGKEPTYTMMKDGYRRSDPGKKFQCCFGMNLIPATTNFSLTIGDSLNVLSTMYHDGKIGAWQPVKLTAV